VVVAGQALDGQPRERAAVADALQVELGDVDAQAAVVRVGVLLDRELEDEAVRPVGRARLVADRRLGARARRRILGDLLPVAWSRIGAWALVPGGGSWETCCPSRRMRALGT
jgi:hypothetical protein